MEKAVITEASVWDDQVSCFVRRSLGMPVWEYGGWEYFNLERWPELFLWSYLVSLN